MVYTIDMDHLYKQLPYLKYNQSALQQLVQDIKWVEFYLPEWEQYEDYDRENKYYYYMIGDDYIQYDCIKEIIDQLPDELKDSSNYDMGHSLYNFPKGYILDIHKDGTTSPPDKKRQSFIHVPISDQASPINFYTEDQELIHSHTYSCATLVNTQTWHNVGIPHVDRISLQINLPMRYTFGQVSEMIEKHFDFM